MTDAIAYSVALVAVASLAWDAARRYIGKRASDDEIGKLKEAMRELGKRNDTQVNNLSAEVKEIIAAHDTRVAAAVAGGMRPMGGIRGAR